jgi:Co/Zn/Cd efflux system component
MSHRVRRFARGEIVKANELICVAAVGVVLNGVTTWLFMSGRRNRQSCQQHRLTERRARLSISSSNEERVRVRSRKHRQDVCVPALTTSLTCSALGANTARARADHLVASADRTYDVHEHVAERFLHSIGMAVAVCTHLRRTIVRRVIGNHVDQVFFTCARKIGNRSVERLLFHLRYFL